ncbi:MAG: hypothetical protein V3T14_07450 [Myxococcota bacterium]
MRPEWLEYAGYAVWVGVGLGYVLLLLLVGAIRGRLTETVRSLPGVFLAGALVSGVAWFGMFLLTSPVPLR